jgi:hypothetical protein
MLNYLYAMLESESRPALAALGLDPGIGVLHFDARARDSFACDLMEAARPDVDAYVLDWLTKRPLSRSWFFEQRDGNCRLMSGFAAQLSATANMWKAAISPVAEWISRAIWSTLPKRSRTIVPAARLTQSYRSVSKGGDGLGLEPTVVQLTRVCRVCGNSLKRSTSGTCRACAVTVNQTNMIEVAKLGRAKSHSAIAEARRAATQSKQRRAERNWSPDSQPKWLTESFFRSQIQPLLASIEVSRVAKSIDVSHPYATSIRRGDRLPHPRHWQNLAKLTGVFQPPNRLAP